MVGSAPSIFDGAEGAVFDEIRARAKALDEYLKETAEAWRSLEKEEKTEENAVAREKVDDDATFIIDKTTILCVDAVKAAVNPVGEKVRERVVKKMNSLRAKNFKTLSALKPLYDLEEETATPSADAIEDWAHTVAILGPEVDWLPTENIDLVLGEDATLTASKVKPAVDTWVQQTVAVCSDEAPSGPEQPVDDDKVLDEATKRALQEKAVENQRLKKGVAEKAAEIKRLEGLVAAKEAKEKKAEEERKKAEEERKKAEEEKERLAEEKVLAAEKELENAKKRLQEAEREKRRVQEERKKRVEAADLENAKLRDQDAVHDRRLDALRSHMKTAPATTAKKSHAKSLGTSLTASVARAVEGRDWDAAAHQKVQERAAEILPIVDGDQATAVKLAVSDIEREMEGHRSNRKSHRSPPGSAAQPIIDHVLAAEKINRESLARSRMVDWRPRPDDRFSNGSHSAYVAQKRAFDRATGGEGVAVEDRFNEFRFWFSGLAMDLIGRRPPGLSAEKAVKRAWQRLDDHFGGRIVSPEESLREILGTGAVGKDDADAHVTLAVRLEEEMDEAEALNCMAAFDEAYVIARVINVKVPHMHEGYWGRLARKDEGPSFAGLIKEIRIRAKTLKRKTIYEPFSGPTPSREPESDASTTDVRLAPTTPTPTTPIPAGKDNRGSGQQVRKLMT